MIKKKILITGGTGFIGYHLAKKCLQLGWNVTSLSTKSPKKIRRLKKVKYKICNLTDKKKLKKFLKNNFDYVVNLAGYVDHSNKIQTKKSHYEGCKNLALLLNEKKIKKFIQVGSSIEYGKISSPQVERKKNNQKTYSVYGYSKLLSTKFLLNLFSKKKFPVTIVRLYLVYGPYQDENRLVPIVIMNAMKDKTFDCSNGKQLRDFTYVEDVVDAFIKIIKCQKTNGEIINIGVGKPIRVKLLIKKICKIVGCGKPNFGIIKMRKDEILKLYPSVKKIKKLIRWKAKIDIKTGLKKTIFFYKNLHRNEC